MKIIFLKNNEKEIRSPIDSNSHIYQIIAYDTRYSKILVSVSVTPIFENIYQYIKKLKKF